MNASRRAKQKLRWQRENEHIHRRASRRWRERNREKAIAASNAYNAAHREEQRQHMRNFRAKNPGYDRVYRAARKARQAWAAFTKVCAANRVLIAALEVSE